MSNFGEINPAVVIGAYINGLGTIYSLAKSKIRIPIISVDSKHAQFGSYSKYVDDKIVFKNPDQFVTGLKKIYLKYGKRLVLFPTGNDYYFRLLFENFNKLESFCYIPVNVDIAKNVMDKKFQHDIARGLGIPGPKSMTCSKKKFSSIIDNLELPIIVKPVTRNRDDQRFRLKILSNQKEVARFKKDLSKLNVESFQASEVIPGNSTQLYTYGSYFYHGKPEGEYVGRKITQYPFGFGVVCIAENKYNKEVRRLGRRLLSHLNFHGISQVEFKFDRRDCKFKLIEINPRSWMWVKLATECCVNLPLIQYRSMTGINVLPSKPVQTDKQKYYVVFSSVLRKLLKGQYQDAFFFFKNLGKFSFSTFSIYDPLPSFMFWSWEIFSCARSSLRFFI